MSANVHRKISAMIHDIIATRTSKNIDVVISLSLVLFRKHSLDHLMT